MKLATPILLSTVEPVGPAAPPTHQPAQASLLFLGFLFRGSLLCSIFQAGLLQSRQVFIIRVICRLGSGGGCGRGAVSSLVVGQGAPTTIELVLRHGEPAVRADDILAGMTRLGGLATEGPSLLTRLDQGPYDEATGEVGDPFAD